MDLQEKRSCFLLLPMAKRKGACKVVIVVAQKIIVKVMGSQGENSLEDMQCQVQTQYWVK
jgi:hypothetical protein